MKKLTYIINKYKYVYYGIVVLVGGLLGYLYWQQIGCASGTCIITSNPINSTLYGAVMGYLVGALFIKEQVD